LLTGNEGRRAYVISTPHQMLLLRRRRRPTLTSLAGDASLAI